MFSLLTNGTTLYYSLFFKELSTYMEIFIKNTFLLKKSTQIFTVFCMQIVLGLVTKQTMGTMKLWISTWDELRLAASYRKIKMQLTNNDEMLNCLSTEQNSHQTND